MVALADFHFGVVGVGDRRRADGLIKDADSHRPDPDRALTVDRPIGELDLTGEAGDAGVGDRVAVAGNRSRSGPWLAEHLVQAHGVTVGIDPVVIETHGDGLTAQHSSAEGDRHRWLIHATGNHRHHDRGLSNQAGVARNIGAVADAVHTGLGRCQHPHQIA